ncbi:hypothetical protein AVEN_115517-1 [Araneus ventricosus]|uniref:Uncharacterized protein n=1 Tax=Araneus ventricosus TaxID=182803 RepID=A0A4Y2CIA1_ARAVE|nr:hypothetical protein AVEN_115517-1 [Araneus ventricosus]
MVWSDSESSFHSITSIDTKSPIAQETQEILLKSTYIKLGRIRAHVGYSGNEAADVLTKKFHAYPTNRQGAVLSPNSGDVDCSITEHGTLKLWKLQQDILMTLFKNTDDPLKMKQTSREKRKRKDS